MAGVTGIRQVSDTSLARFGYVYDNLSAKDRVYEYAGHKAYAGVQFTMGQTYEVTLMAQYYHRDFEGPLSGRREQRYTASAAARWKLGNRTYLGVSGTYINNESDNGLYEYNRAITGLFIKARY